MSPTRPYLKVQDCKEGCLPGEHHTVEEGPRLSGEPGIVASRVIRTESLKLSEPHFHHLKMAAVIPYPEPCVRIKGDKHKVPGIQ